jgi:PAS domain S-box-containing protein
MDASRSRPWVGAALAVLALLFVVDLATAPHVAVITLYGIAPLIASLGATWRSTAGVGALALLAGGHLAPAHQRHGARQRDPVHLRVAALGALATGGALIRTAASGAAAARACSPRRARRWPAGRARRPAARRRGRGRLHDHARAGAAPGAPLLARGERLGTLALAAPDLELAAELAQRCAAAIDSAALMEEADEAYGLLDAVFARAPVGLALYDHELRVVRINDHLAEIDGMPAAEQIGRPVTEIVPDVEGIVPAMREVLASGRALANVELAGETRAAPGVRREFTVSYFPVRRRGDGEVLGVGCVVFEVTERREAERALREQTVRYESLLRALSEVGEGMLVLEDDRLVYANPAFLAMSGYSTESCRRSPRCSTSSRRPSARTPAGARSCASRASATPATS